MIIDTKNELIKRFAKEVSSLPCTIGSDMMRRCAMLYKNKHGIDVTFILGDEQEYCMQIKMRIYPSSVKLLENTNRTQEEEESYWDKVKEIWDCDE